MNQFTAIVFGTGICCVIPLLALIAGVYIGRHGMPISIRWNGRRQRLADDGDAD